MALNGKQAYAIAKKYTNDTVIGLGGIKGKNCIIQSAIKTNGITDVIFQWTDDNEEVQTTSIQVADGQDDIAITNVDVNEFNHLICMLSDGTIIDAGEIAVSTKASEMDNDLGLTKVENSTSNGNIKIDGVETTVYTLPTLTKSSVGLGNVDNTSDASKPVSTATQTALNTKASTTTLTTHTGNADIHVTAADKTAWNLMPKSKGEIYSNDIHSYQDFVIPILNVASTYSNEYFYGQIYLKRINGVGQQMTIINLMCGKNYNEEKAVYYMDKSHMWTTIKPCSFMYNGKKMFGIHVKIIASDYNILRVDARTTTNFDSITPVYIYNNNTSAVLNAEIYNSLSFFDGYNMPMNFYEIPKVIKTDGTATKLLSFSPVPATLTSTGTAGEIAYDTNYLYTCITTNTWKKTAWDADVYSTTETLVGTYMGKPLYRKVIVCGALPNNASKEILHNTANINIIPKTSGTAWMNDGTTIPLSAVSLSSPVVVYSDRSKISITTITDRSAFTNSNVTIEYTKTTD